MVTGSTMPDTTHLTALHTRLSHERGSLTLEKTSKGRSLRAVWIGQLEKEIACERILLGLADEPAIPEMTDEGILAQLGM